LCTHCVTCVDMSTTHATNDALLLLMCFFQVVVIAHALCHLCGHVHDTHDEAATMRAEETRLLRLYEAAKGLPHGVLQPLTTASMQ
jgi:hypothetical protein